MTKLINYLIFFALIAFVSGRYVKRGNEYSNDDYEQADDDNFEYLNFDEPPNPPKSIRSIYTRILDQYDLFSGIFRKYMINFLDMFEHIYAMKPPMPNDKMNDQSGGILTDWAIGMGNINDELANDLGNLAFDVSQPYKARSSKRFFPKKRQSTLGTFAEGMIEINDEAANSRKKKRNWQNVNKKLNFNSRNDNMHDEYGL